MQDHVLGSNASDPVAKNAELVEDYVPDPSEPPAALKGTSLPVTPKFKANLTARYVWTLGEMDAQHAIVQRVDEIAHVLTGRSEVRTKKKAGLGSLLDRLKMKKA